MSGRYLIVTPAHNEEEFLGVTLTSVAAQRVLPHAWVVVDDCSTDGTWGMLESFASTHPWVRPLRRLPSDRPSGTDGLASAAEAAAFNAGLRQAADVDWDFVVKLDADIELPPDYFERLLAEFAADPSLGIAGGHCYEWRRGRLWWEAVPEDHVRGATKMYRRECFEAIGGMRETLGWDTIDQVTAEMRGWKVRSIRGLDLLHHRRTGSASGVIRGRLRHGRGSYLVGYHPGFMFVRAARRLLDPPPIVGSVLLLAGYFAAWLRREPRAVDAEFVAFFRRRQLGKLRHPLAALAPRGGGADGR